MLILQTLHELFMVWRFLPLVGIVLVIVLAFCVRPLLQYRRHGTFGVFLFNSRRPAQSLHDFLLVLLGAALIAQAVVTATRRNPHAHFLIWQGPVHEILQFAGAMVMFAGIALFAVAELQLGPSWRIGVEEGAKPGLVTCGLYRFCRNPIFLGALIMLTGYAALLPTPLSVALLLGAYVGFRAQAAIEEDYLQRTYGEAYRDYARRVGRFVPGVGKL